MAQTIVIKVTGDTKEFERAVKQATNAAGANMRQFSSGIDASVGSVRTLRQELSGLKLLLGAATFAAGIAALKQIGDFALQAAVNIDRQVSSLRALTGSAEAATKRFQELFAIAQKTPGLTSNLATQLDAQLRVFNVAERTINRLLPTIGRLNAVAPLGDPNQFIRNIVQLATQNFEVQDLRELVGQSPIAGQLIQQIFNVDSPINGEAIRKAAKRLGITSVERLAEELIKAGENNSALKNAVETLGGQFDKLKDRLDVALAPLGKEIATTLIPVFDDIVKAVERYGQSAAQIFAENRFDIQAAAREVALLGVEFAKLFGRLASSPQVREFFGNLSVQAARTRDLLNAPTSERAGILFGVTKGPQQLEAERTLRENEARRAFPNGYQPNMRIDMSEESRLAAEAYAKFIEQGGGRGGGNRSGRPTGGRSGGGRDRQPVDLFLSAERQTLENQRRFIEEQQRAIDQNMDRVFRAAIEARDAERKAQLEGDRAIRQALTRDFEGREETLRQGIEDLRRTSRRSLSRSGRSIDDLVSRGAITPEQADALRQSANRQYAQSLREVLAREQRRGATAATLDDLRDEIELYDRLGSAISESERFMRGFNSQIMTSGDIWDRFGQSVARSLTNVRGLLDGLKQSLLQLFNDLLGRSLQNLVGQALAPLAGLFGGGFGPPALAGTAGNIFRTPGTFPASVSGSAFQSIAQAIGGAGGGISAPPSISATQQIQQIFGDLASPATRPRTVTGGGVSGAARGIFGGFSLGSIGRSLGAAAPFLGVSLGAGLGGRSVLGQILGAAGAGVIGTGIGVATGAITNPAIIGLFANPFTIPLAIGAIVGGIFLGKAKQRRQDEEASGQFLTQALQAIDQLALGVQSGQINGAQARQIFESQILGTFKQQISGLQTKSVRESRLANQVRDLRNVFEARIPPLIAEQEKRARDAARFAAIDSRLIPQFAGGGIVPGIDRGFDSVRALLRPGEMVLTRAQQSAVRSIAGPSVFDRAGVPGVNRSGVFDGGGIAPAAQGGGEPMVIELDVHLGMSQSGAEEIVSAVARTRNGQNILVDATQRARKRNRSV